MRRRLLLVMFLLWPGAVHAQSGPRDVIDTIVPSIVHANRDGKGTTWFHPRGCLIPTPKGPLALLTMQEITGSDYYGPVHWSVSRDQAKSWSEPKPVPGLGNTPFKDGIEQGVCDVVPEYHAKTDTVLAVGYRAYYKEGKHYAAQRPLYPANGFKGDQLQARIRQFRLLERGRLPVRGADLDGCANAAVARQDRVGLLA